METRREWKQNVCERSNKASRELLSPLMERVVYYVKSKNFLWCPVFKAASTNWMQNIMLLSDLSKRQIAQLEKQYPQQPNQQARQAAPFIKKKQIKTIEEDESSFRFIVTRHPFHRLLSAFRDKFERCIPDFDCTKRTDWYYHRQGKGIVDKYRKLALNKFGKIFFSKENNYGAPFPVAKRINEKLPSWWEFIQHVLSVTPSRFDEHFKPIHLLCSSCAYDFNFILRYENISIEEPFLVQQLGAEGIIKSKWENSNKGNVTEKQLIDAYFDLLSNSEINRLYDIYRLDFKQFNYTFTFRGITYNDLSEKH